jgi:flavin reductase (DIM6/NTAB) family NADH-FMN oxidoreductase RutF
MFKAADNHMNVPVDNSSAEEYAPVDPPALRATLGRFVTGVTVITTRCPRDNTAGVTVSSFNALSLDPPLILWSLSLNAPSLKVFRDSERFAVNILAEDQSAIALQFARSAPDKFADVETTAGIGGVPLIDGAVAHIECTVEHRYPGGDHELIIGRIVRALANEKTPLVYGHGKFWNFPVNSVVA